jgi:APA family basic amino acid/polyamine antiporter
VFIVSHKIGFWSVFAIVTGSQIGSSVFMSPISLAPYGFYGVIGYCISSFAAISLCFVFSHLCSKFPKTGGPHVYVKHILGNDLAFFTGWTYWIISWVSTTTVILAVVGYLTPFFGDHHDKSFYVFLEIAILLCIVALNLKGLKFAGAAEFVLSIIKFIPLLLVPCFAFGHFNSENFIVHNEIATKPISEILGKVTLLTLFGFIGLETATAPAESVKNPTKTIPKAIILGTLFVSFLYILNCLAIMGMVDGEKLAHAKAPYVDVAKILFGGNWHLVIAALSAIICIGTLNAWILTSGQIALGLARDGFMPQFFNKQNKNEAPQVAILISSIGIIPLLFLTANENLATQATYLIDISVISFLFVYLICTISFLKDQITSGINIYLSTIGLLALAFCLWIIYETKIETLGISSFFTLTGLPLYIFWYKRSKC